MKSLGYEAELVKSTWFQNTYILNDLERKISIDAYNSWNDVKNEMMKKNQDPDLSSFATFYEGLVFSVNDAKYMRSTFDAINKQSQNKKGQKEEK